MLLRLRGPDGMVRLTVEKTDTFRELGRQVCVPECRRRPRRVQANSVQFVKLIPDTVDPNTITLSNAPTGNDSKLLFEILSIKIGQIGLR